MAENLKLTQAMNARICHDLAGSIGIVDNCLSLIDNKNEKISAEAKLLLNEESNNLIRKIKLFRNIYGTFDNEEKMSIIYINKLIRNHFVNSNVKIRIHSTEETTYFTSLIGKVLICLAIIAADNINSSGSIELFLGSNSDKTIKVTANSKSLRLKNENLLMLTTNNIDFIEGSNELNINASNCREYYVNILCRSAGYKIVIDKKKDLIEYSIVKL